MPVRLGLRGKSALILIGLCLVALIPATFLGWRAVDSIHRHFATAYVEQYTLQHMQRILAPVARELALSRRMANSVVTHEWFANEDHAEPRNRFFAEADRIRREFAEEAYFAIVHESGHYYFSDGEEEDPREPRYTVEADNPDDAWYFSTVGSDAPYNINADLDRELQITNLWINVPAVDPESGEILGVTGTGLELTRFLEAFVHEEAPGVTPMIIDPRGALQAHPSPERIAYRSGALGEALDVDESQTIQGLLDDAADIDRLMDVVQAARDNDGVETLWVAMDDRPQLMAVGYLPDLDWHVVTTLDPGVAQVFDVRQMWVLFITLLVILGAALAAFVYATDRLVLSPLGRLKASAQAIAQGDFRTRLPVVRNDEIGDLSRTFTGMAEQIESHTRELEEKVRERTRELEEANARMADAHRKISDSIEYASIIQRAILPDAQLDEHLEHSHGVLWKPRDTVGGDFYVFRAGEQGYLLGVVDCAGHGVPGSLMTMLARAIIDNAILTVGEDDPAEILNEIDRKTRETLPREQLPSSISTNMDIGLVWIDARERKLYFAGAKMALYASDGESVEVLTGARRAVGHRRQARYTNAEGPIRSGWTYCLCTDGFLDQSGGRRGFGFGEKRFRAMLQAHAHRPLGEQITAFERELQSYQGDLPQRDDITVLTFRFRDGPPESTT